MKLGRKKSTNGTVKEGLLSSRHISQSDPCDKQANENTVLSEKQDLAAILSLNRLFS